MKIRTLIITSILGAGLSFSLTAAAQDGRFDNYDVVHDTGRHVVRNTFGNCVRTSWDSQSNECRDGYRLGDEELTVYFEFNKTVLMESQRRKLNSLADVLKSMNDISGVSIVGYADRIGTVDYNEDLSKRRAKVVEEYLRERGYLNTTLAKTRWLGESAPITQCKDGMSRKALIACLQKDRRVTVEIQYKNDR